MSANHRRKRVLVVLEWESLPSSRVRALQYRPHFDASDSWRAAYRLRRSEPLERLLARSRRPHIPLVMPLLHAPAAALVARWQAGREDAIATLAAECDLVYLVKVPDVALYRRLRALGGPRVVMDFNDGLWLPAFKAAGWQDLDAILDASDGVICENDYVAGYARKRNARVRVVPDSPQLEVFDALRAAVRRDPGRIVLGWVGGHENVGALYRILEPLEELFRRHPGLHLRVLGADAPLLPRFENVRWSCLPRYDQATMVREMLAFDIGLFPMFHNEDGKARGNLKAMLYMSAGAVAACEDFGECPRLVEDGVNGILAGEPGEWLAKLDGLVRDRERASRIAGAGLETIRSRFSTPGVFGQLVSALDQLHAG